MLHWASNRPGSQMTISIDSTFGSEYIFSLRVGRDIGEMLLEIYRNNLDHKFHDEEAQLVDLALDEWMQVCGYPFMPSLADKHIRTAAERLFNQGAELKVIAGKIAEELGRFGLLSRVRRICPDYPEQVLHDVFASGLD